MTPFKFYFYFGIFVESFPLIPILYAVSKWKCLSWGIKFFVLFLVSELVLNIISDYFYFTGSYNLFLYYYYSFFQLVFMFLTFNQFFKLHLVKTVISSLFIVCLISLVIDYTFLSKVSYNFLSGILICLIVTLISGYYFATNILKSLNNNQSFSEINVRFSLIITLHFFVKALIIFLEKIYFDTQNNPFLWIQMRNIYYYFMLFCLILYCISFRNIKSI